MRCRHPTCKRLWSGHLRKWPTAGDEEIVFKSEGEVSHDSNYVPRHKSSEEAREELLRQLGAGKGPTEAQEDVAMQYKEKAPTLASARKNRNPGVNRIPTQVQMLDLLRRSYQSLIEPSGPVKGYIQVRPCPTLYHRYRSFLVCNACHHLIACLGIIIYLRDMFT